MAYYPFQKLLHVVSNEVLRYSDEKKKEIIFNCDVRRRRIYLSTVNSQWQWRIVIGNSAQLAFSTDVIWM